MRKKYESSPILLARTVSAMGPRTCLLGCQVQCSSQLRTLAGASTMAPSKGKVWYRFSYDSICCIVMQTPHLSLRTMVNQVNQVKPETVRVAGVSCTSSVGRSTPHPVGMATTITNQNPWENYQSTQCEERRIPNIISSALVTWFLQVQWMSQGFTLPPSGQTRH